MSEYSEVNNSRLTDVKTARAGDQERKTKELHDEVRE